VICKLDIKKAYDYVNWDCLIYLMRENDKGGLEPISLMYFISPC
jgi:hypothetical protein